MDKVANAIEWLKASKDDLDAIIELLHNPNLTNIASFHAQQSIEKSFKAIIEYKRLPIQKTHNLEKLYLEVNDFITIKNEGLLELINELYIDSRYPGDLGLLPSGKPTIEEAKEFYDFAKNIFDTISSTLDIDK